MNASFLPIAKWIIIRSCYLLRMCIFKWSLFVCICVWWAFFPFWRSRSLIVDGIHSSDESFLATEWLKNTQRAHVIFHYLNIQWNWMCRDNDDNDGHDIQTHFSFAIFVCSLACACLLLSRWFWFCLRSISHTTSCVCAPTALFAIDIVSLLMFLS